MIDLPSSDQAYFEGPTLIPIVGNNIGGGGGESVLLDQLFFISQSDFHMLFQLLNTAYVRNCS